MLQISGECNDCGQCCGCETAPNRTGPFPKNWPEAVNSWQINVLRDAHPVFQITGHPDLGGLRFGSVRPVGGNTTFHWIWIPGVGLVADAPPWGDESTYELQCPFLKSPVSGVYPCGVIGTVAEIIKTQMRCRWLPPTWDERSWNEWKTNHPDCSYEATPIP